MMDPLVSVLLVTAGRRDVVQRALACYEAQDYVRRELVIVDDPDDPSFDAPAGDRYTRASGSVGRKRALGGAFARGEIIAHMDSDDWYARDYVTDVVDLLLSERANVAGYRSVPFFDIEKHEWWLYSGPDWYVCGATMAYRRCWATLWPFPHVKAGEDAVMAWNAWKTGTLATKTAGWKAICTIHSANTSPRDTSSRLWRKLADDEVPEWATALWR